MPDSEDTEILLSSTVHYRDPPYTWKAIDEEFRSEVEYLGSRYMLTHFVRDGRGRIVYYCRSEDEASKLVERINFVAALRIMEDR